MMKPVLILKMGQTLVDIGARRGGFEDWFAKGLAVPTVSHDAQQSVPDSANNYAGIVITGSGSMVSHRESWSEQAAAWLAEAVAASVPVLGVCYGHQLLAHALGGEVGPNPHAREIGTKCLHLKKGYAQDPLLQTLTTPVFVQTSHLESVLSLPAGAKVLATTAQDPYHVLRFSDTAWGIQFHPEFDADIMRSYIELRHAVIQQEGFSTQQLLSEVRETPQAWALLQRFAGLLID